MNHPVKKEQCEHEWNTDAYGKPVSCYKCHTKFITSTTSVPSPRPDGWDEWYVKLFNEFDNRHCVDLLNKIDDIVENLLTSQHHKDIEAFRGMIESEKKNYDGFWQEIENMGKNANRHGPSSQAKKDGKDAFSKLLLTALSTFASTDTGKEKHE